LEEISQFSLAKNSDIDSKLYFDKCPCHINISGIILEKQYRLNTGFKLIFTSDDCPYEETLHITLLSKEHTVVDALDLGMAYHSAIFDNIALLSENTLEFNFFSDTRYHLFIENDGLKFSLKPSLPEVNYSKSLFSKRYIKIKKL